MADDEMIAEEDEEGRAVEVREVQGRRRIEGVAAEDRSVDRPALEYEGTEGKPVHVGTGQAVAGPGDDGVAVVILGGGGSLSTWIPGRR